jgi:hypothetical protein
MKIKIIHSDHYNDSDIQDLIEIQKNNQEHENYISLDWENKPNTLLHVFIKQQRFAKNHGGLILLYNHDDRLITVSGYNRSSFDKDVFIGGVRTLVDRDYRHQLLLSKHIIAVQLESIKKMLGKIVAFTFDVNNISSLYHIYRKNKIRVVLQNNKFNYYDNLQILEYPVQINNCLQNVLYIKLDENYDYDWSRLR